MKYRPLQSTLICAAVLGALSLAPAMAQTTTPTDTSTSTSTTSHESTRLSTEFAGFAGSDANAQALVSGLRDGSAVTLDDVTKNADGTTTTASTTFTPATGKMGYGNVKIALSLAEASLAKAGITDPTAAEMQAALNGGTLVLADGTSIKLDGILAARAAGEGWGQIAKADGFKLGDVMRSPKAAGAAAADGHAHAHVEKVELAKVHGVDRPGKPEHVAKADRPARLDRPDRPSRPERPEHPDHAGRPGG
ncbi:MULTISPECIES: hypothetical protein [Rhodanobacter]|uniref:hypothetical protein n=1 Tax=Rhodanobacter TaxID=75309 RepID=UPI00042930C4|nr:MULTISPECIES: hypothetical protein [Rhodanobacter]KZC18544.1 hypothetical protein RHOFW104R3_35925 [Rhodanobacter denitrificans]UJJ50815.1 hypothetical protein LRK52_16495 [Rhodanobacter denitrificans]UJJ56985.1 hypothetical protein LRK55_09870 [Rhodanobacter denitrificans]UJM93530.1 hypothetical protein LRK32_16400 [Rhodanobacter denitrificans]UJM97061.1 hypothetical protein LRK44_16410 [Rhodanobacter denitrificans]